VKFFSQIPNSEEGMLFLFIIILLVVNVSGFDCVSKSTISSDVCRKTLVYDPIAELDPTENNAAQTEVQLMRNELIWSNFQVDEQEMYICAKTFPPCTNTTLMPLCVKDCTDFGDQLLDNTFEVDVKNFCIKYFNSEETLTCVNLTGNGVCIGGANIAMILLLMGLIL